MSFIGGFINRLNTKFAKSPTCGDDAMLLDNIRPIKMIYFVGNTQVQCIMTGLFGLKVNYYQIKKSTAISVRPKQQITSKSHLNGEYISLGIRTKSFLIALYEKAVKAEKPLLG